MWTTKHFPSLLINSCLIREQRQFHAVVCYHAKFLDVRQKKYDKYFKVLGIQTDSTQELVRQRYIQLVKQFHPDTGKDACMEKFLEVDQAYKQLQIKFMEDQGEDKSYLSEWDTFTHEHSEDKEEEKPYDHPDIRHTAPQHRQYLDNEGFGFGTPGQRQRQYQKIRAMKAADSVLQHRVDKLSSKYETALATQERAQTKKHMTQNAMERLVEDLITESMSKGEFDNLQGSGKPLRHRLDFNPYMDFTAHKMNEILVEGGFAPEWIMLKKDIALEKTNIQELLTKKRSMLGRYPLCDEEQRQWDEICMRIKNDEVKQLNNNINRYNLIVPMLNGQMFHLNFEAEAQRILQTCMCLEDVRKLADEQRKVDLGDTTPVTSEPFFQKLIRLLSSYRKNLHRSS
ncbi:dnaJ homolog subfamily C member 28-like [Tigriopus californicus]|nr:dnaJ homolog subfamily C member 28-like [Tigriopus californicus]